MVGGGVIIPPHTHIHTDRAGDDRGGAAASVADSGVNQDRAVASADGADVDGSAVSPAGASRGYAVAAAGEGARDRPAGDPVQDVAPLQRNHRRGRKK